MSYPIATRGGRGSGNSTPYVPALGDLVLSGALVAGVASSGTILNAFTGSTITSGVSGLSVNSAARTYTYTGAGAAGSTNNGLIETLAGATFSPRGNVVTIVSAAVPAFTSNPSISPQGGNVGGTFSGIDGAMSSGGSILSRRWLLNGTSIGSGTTVVPASAGSLVFENTGTGNVVASSSAVTVAAVAGTPSIAFAAPTSSVTEGDSGTKTVSNVINVTRNGVTGPLTVNLSYSGTATSGTDYVAGPVSGTIADGQTSLSFDLTINGDTGVEGDETIVINAVLAAYSSATASKTLTVTNDDVTATPIAVLGVSPQAFTQGAAAGSEIGSISSTVQGVTAASVNSTKLAVNAAGTKLLVGVAAAAANEVIAATLTGTDGGTSPISILCNSADTGAATVNFFADNGASAPWYGQTVGPSHLYDTTSKKFYLSYEGVNPAIPTRRSHYLNIVDETTMALTGPYYMGDSALSGDDHGIPQIDIHPTNRRMYRFGGAHGGYMQWSYSAANDYTTWTQGTPIQPPSAADGYSYPHAVMAGSKIWLFMRKMPATGGAYDLVVVPGTLNADGSVVWGVEQILISNGGASRVYLLNPLLLSSSGDDIVVRLYWDMADGTDTYRQDLFAGDYSSAAGTITNINGTVTRSTATFLPLSTSRISFRLTNQFESNLFTTACSHMYDPTTGNYHVLYAEDADDNSVANAPIDIMWRMYSPAGALLAGPQTLFQTQQRYDSVELIPAANGGIDAGFTSADAYGFSRGGNISKVTRSAAGVWTSTPANVAVCSPSIPYDRVVAIKNGNSKMRYVFGENAVPPYQGNTGGGAALTLGNVRTIAVGDAGIISFPFTPHPKSQAWAARCQTQPNTSQMKRVDAIIRNLFNGVASLSMDAFYLLGGLNADEAQACSLDLIGTRDLVVNSGMTFAQIPGQLGYAWKGNGSGATMDTGFIPSTAGGKMSLNDAGESLYILTEGQSAANDFDIEQGNTGGTSFLNPRNASDQAVFRLNNAAGTNTVNGNTTAVGLYVYRRTGASGSNSSLMLKNGNQFATTGNAASSSLPNKQITLFGSKGATVTSTRQLACAGFGKSVGLLDVDAYSAAQLRYMRDAGLIV